MKKTYVFTILSILLLTSGCTTTNVVQTPGGVDILDFSPLPDTVYSGEEAKLIYEIQNNGAYDSNIEVYLEKIDTDKWSATETSTTISSLPKKQQKVEGGKEIGFFSITAPEIDKNTRQIFNAELKMCYLYKTQTVFKYDITNSFEKQKKIEQGTYARKIPFYRNSISPLLVEPLTKEPLYGGKDEVTLSFRVKDHERGMLINSNTCVQNPDAGEFNNYQYTLTSPDAGITITCDEDTVRLVDGISIFYCTLSGISGKTSVTLTMTSEYAYYQSKSTRITVNGI
ncbi:MAG: hypothetical protein KAR87_05900 [Candidatus Aenigmarchaeota archaeon]|nr:hypothetical protein [Candidatus Aenigmarchaeota archaeon]